MSKGDMKPVPHAARRGRTMLRDTQWFRVLLVSEDPRLIVEAQEHLRDVGGVVVGCLGPAHAPCNLDVRGICPLVEHADVVLVEAPPAGCFSRRWDVVPVHVYARRLTLHHPDCAVVVVGAPGALGAWPAAGVYVTDRAAALAHAVSLATELRAGRGRGRDESLPSG